MINAAIVGLGWWGQNLVNSVRQSAALRFSLAHTRNQAAAAPFCAEAGLRWVGSLDAILQDKAIDAVHGVAVFEAVARSAASGLPAKVDNETVTT